jgi:flagellar biosynthesis protein FlhF
MHAVERLEILAPSKLIITRLDEATAPGAMLAARFRTGKPVSLLGSGQRIPEDLQPATREYLIDRLLENCWSETPAAA